MIDIFSYLIIQLFDISGMSDILNHLIIYLSNIFGASNVVNYSIISNLIFPACPTFWNIYLFICLMFLVFPTLLTI